MRFNTVEEVPMSVLEDIVVNGANVHDGTLGKYLKSISAELKTVPLEVGQKKESGMYLILVHKDAKAIPHTQTKDK